jgi:putative acyl-CoA dehydrogenase
MRFGVRQACHHAEYRMVFGLRLRDQPLMRNVLADLILESEAATAVALRLAGATDRAMADPTEAAFRRLGLAVTKYWVCKRGPAHAAEALECLGGNGYVEDSDLPRLYREAPLVSIWEGSGNVAALDALRAMRGAGTVEAFLGEMELAAGADSRFDAALARLQSNLVNVVDIAEADARRMVERLALLLQASLLVRYAPPAIADAFCASRLSGDWGRAFGTLPNGVNFAAVLDRPLFKQSE